MSSLIGVHAVYRDGVDIGTLTITQGGNMTVFDLSCGYSSGDVLRLAGVSGGNYVNIGVVTPEGGRLRLRKGYSKNMLAALALEPDAGFFLILKGEKYVNKNVSMSVRVELQAAAPEEATESIPANEAEIICEEAPEEFPEDAPEEIPDAGEDITEDHEQMQDGAGESEESGSWSFETVSAESWRPISDPSVLFNDGDIASACRNVRGALTMEKEGVTLLAIPAAPEEPFPLMPVFCFGDSVRIGGVEYIVFKSRNGNFVI